MTMADTPPVSSSPSTASTPPSSAAEQARLRKERREAKIKAGGSARLNRITGLGGGFQREIPVPSPQPADQPLTASPHYYQPSTTPRPSTSESTPNPSSTAASSPSPSPSPAPGSTGSSLPTDAQLRQLMLGLDPSARASPSASPGLVPQAQGPQAQGQGGQQQFPFPLPPGAENDPMMAMLQQFMGNMPGGGFPGMAAGAGSSSAQGQPAFPQQQQQQAPAPPNPYAYVWRVLHAVFALALGLYVSLSTGYAGTKLERDVGRVQGSTGTGGASTLPIVNTFYMFATAEVVLQSSRFFLERRGGGGLETQPGLLGVLVGFLPLPYKTYVGQVLRYGRIWTRVSEDALVCLFVLGVAAWWRAGAA